MKASSFLFFSVVSICYITSAVSGAETWAGPSTLSPIPAAGVLIDGHSGQSISFSEAVENVMPGDIVVLGEEHGTTVQPEIQLQVMQALRDQGLSVSAGLEFYEYPWQKFVDQYRAGALSETDFLADIGWGPNNFPFSSYRGQTVFPALGEAFTIALNIPQAVVDQIAQGGVQSLTADEKALMPPHFTLGDALYFQRFKLFFVFCNFILFTPLVIACTGFILGEERLHGRTAVEFVR